MLPLVRRPRLPLPGHQPPHRRLRRSPRPAGPPAARDRGRRAPGHRQPLGPWRPHLRRRADRGRDDHRRCRPSRGAGRGQRPGRLRQHLDRRGDRQPLHDRGVDAHPAGLRAVHPERAAQGGRPAGHRRGPLQGSVASGTSTGGGPLRPGGRGARPDRRRRLRGQGPGRGHRRHPLVPLVQPGVRRADGAEPLARVHREPEDGPRVRRCRSAAGSGTDRPPAAGHGGRGRAGRAAGGHRRGSQRPPGDRLREGAAGGRPGAPRRHRAQPGRAR